MAIKLLQESNHTKEVEILQAEEQQLKKLSAELLSIDPHHTSHRKLQELENKLITLETRINQQLQNLAHSPEVIRQLIIDNFGNYSEVVEERIKELKEENFEGFAEDLQSQLEKIESLVEQLKATTEHKDIEKLDNEIAQLSRRMARDLDLLRRDLHLYQSLLNSTEKLLAVAEHAETELNARNLTDLVELIKVDAQEIVVVRDQYKNERSILVFDYLQEKLVDLEQRLRQKLNSIEKQLNPHNERARRDAPNDILENSTKLLNAAREAIEKLKSEGKHELALGLESIEKVLIDIQSQMSNIHPHSILGKIALEGLENLLKKAENDLEAELKRLGLNH